MRAAIASQEYGPAAAAAAAVCQLGSRRLVADQLRERLRERRRVPGRDQADRAVTLPDLGEAADRARDDRLAEGERGVEHARLLDPAVREGDDVGAAKVGGISGSVMKRSTNRTVPRAALGQPSQRGRGPCAACRRSTARPRRPGRRPRAERRRPCRGGRGRSRGSPAPRRPRARPAAGARPAGGSGSRRRRGGSRCTRVGSADQRPQPSAPCSEWAITASMRESRARWRASARRARHGSG